MAEAANAAVWRERGRTWAITAGSIVLALIAGAVLMVVSDPDVITQYAYLFTAPGLPLGASWAKVSSAYGALVLGAVGSPNALAATAWQAAPLICAGLGVGLGFRAGLFNIGAQGQAIWGSIAAAYLGFALQLPPVIHLIVAVIGGLIAGAIWGGIVGFLKARTGAHEVIVTIMLNFMILALLNWIVASRLHEPETVHTPAIRAGAFPRLSETFSALHGSAANHTIVVAVLVAVLVTIVLFRSRFGFDLRAVGAQPDAAESGGIRVGRVWIQSLALAGALAGMGGANFVLGYKGYYEDGLAGGAGFMGIAVALVGKNHPGGVALAALLFATLSQGGLAIHAAVPKQLVEVLQATVILAMAAIAPVVRHLLEQRRAVEVDA